MANAKFSTLATQFSTNAAAIATAAGGTIVTSDITALADFLKTLSLFPHHCFPIIAIASPGLASTQLTPG